MKKIFKTTLLLLGVATAAGMFVSCSEDDLPAADALFRPILTEDNIEHGLTSDNIPYMIIRWDNYNTADQYNVKVEAADGSDSKAISTDTTFYRFDNLQYDKEYNISISAANTKNGLQSKPFTLTTTSLDYPTSLGSVSATDLVDVAARIRWSDAAYTHLKVYHDSKDSLVSDITLTDEDKAARELIVGNLSPSTSYRVEAYANDSYRGKRRFTTTAAEKFGGNVIDLRGLDETTAWKWFSVGSGSGYANTLDSLIKTQYQDQDLTIVLDGGVRYRIATIELPATTGIITLTTGLTLAGNAQLCVEGNFRSAASSKVGGMTFSKIDFTDSEAKPRTQDQHYGSTYIFNFNQSGGDMSIIKFFNCSIKYKRGICRIQTAATIDSVVIDNCIIDSISGYGITNADNAKAAILNVKMTNTTVSNAEKTFVGSKPDADHQPNSLVVENCTFVYCIADAKPFFDFNSKNWTSFKDKFVFKNCLVGLAGRNKEELATTGISGWSGSVQPECTDIYVTKDLLWQPLSDEDPSPKAAFPSETLSTTTIETFKSPLTSDFTITTGDLGGSSKPTPGDPRWY